MAGIPGRILSCGGRTRGVLCCCANAPPAPPPAAHRTRPPPNPPGPPRPPPPPPPPPPPRPTPPPQPSATPAPQIQPAIGMSVIGHSAEGRAIRAYTLGNGTLNVAIVGGLHGAPEANSADLVWQLLQYYAAGTTALP